MENKSDKLISKLIKEPLESHEALSLLLKHLKNENIQYLDMGNSFGDLLIKKRQETKKNWIKFWSAVTIIVCIAIAITAAILLILSSLTLSGIPLLPFLLVSVPLVWVGGSGIITFTLAPFVALCIGVIASSSLGMLLSILSGILVSTIGINKLHDIPDTDDNYVLGFAEKISHLLEKNNTIRELNLRGCVINEEGIQLIINALQVNTTITTLLVDSESISTESFNAIQAELEKNKNIKLQNENTIKIIHFDALKDTYLIQDAEKLTGKDMHFNFTDFMCEIKNNLNLFNNEEANEKMQLVRDVKQAKKESLVDLVESEKRGYGFFQSSSRSFMDKLVPLEVLESRL